MTGNMDLIRQILFSVEKLDYQEHWNEDSLKGDNETSPESIGYQVELLKEAGLIKAWVERNSYGYSFKIEQLTWNGHDFLDAARDEGRWEQAKDIVKEKGGSLSFDVFKALLVQLARQAVGLG